MKKFSVIFLVIVIGFMFGMNVYPDGFARKFRISFSQQNGFFCYKGGMFNRENKTVLYSRPLNKNSTSPSHNHYEYYSYNKLFNSGQLSNESRYLNQAQRMGRPRLSSEKMVNAVLAGIAGNIAFGFAGGLIGGIIGSESSEFGGYMGSIFIGAAVGSALGSAVGVYIVGNSRYVKGSFGQALLGGALGVCGAVVAGSSTVWSGLAGYSLLILPPLCATLFFNRSLRYKNSPEYGNALLNFREGRLRPGIPRFSVQPLPDFRNLGKMAFRFKVKMLSIQF